jgi:DsbC/DsbD-like thiol-disulfide interchange protein
MSGLFSDMLDSLPKRGGEGKGTAPQVPENCKQTALSLFPFFLECCIAGTMRAIVFVLTIWIFSSPLIAGETEWQEVAPEARLRLISSDVRRDDNKTLLALELKMPETTWTYWRVPGETGIPLQLDFSGSTGIKSYEIQWPFPTREMNSGYLDYVYRGDVVLPIELETEGDAPFLLMKAVLGVCSEICVPVFASFEQQLDFSRRDSAHALRITQALSRAPIPWDRGLNPVRALAFDEENRQMLVALSGVPFDAASMILATSNPSIVFGSPQKSQIEGVVAFPKLGRIGDAGLAEQAFTITFMSPFGPYELEYFPVPLSELEG